MSDGVVEGHEEAVPGTVGNHKERSSYDQLQDVRTELDLVRCSEDIEDDLLEAGLEEYQ